MIKLLRITVFVATWLAVILLGNLMARERVASMPEKVDLITQIFGESRSMLSTKFVRTGDIYFHGGFTRRDCPDFGHVEHGEPPAEESGEDESCPACAGVEGGHEHHDGAHAASGHGPADDGAHDADGHLRHDSGGSGSGEPWKSLSRGQWVRALRREIRPSGHRHLHTKRETKEVLPWFWVATKVDPHNVQAYDLGTFWLARQTGEPGKALDFVTEGIGKNPDAFELELARGEVLERLSQAAARLEAAGARALVPEISSQLAFALPSAVAPDDVAAFPGRIVKFGPGVRAVGCPAFVWILVRRS